MADSLSEDYPRLIRWLTNSTFQAAFAVLALIAIVYFSISFYMLMPYIGASLSLREDVLMIETVDENGPTEKSGAQAGDRILFIDGYPSAVAAYKIVSGDLSVRPGDVVTVMVQRGDRNLIFFIELGSYLDNPTRLGIFSGIQLVALGFWGVGLVLCLFTSSHNAGPRLVALCWLVGGIGLAAGGPVGGINLVAYTTMMVAGCLGFALFVSAHLYFPKVSFGDRLRKRVVYALTVVALLLSILQILEDWVFSCGSVVVDFIGIPLYAIIDIFQILGTLLGIGLLARTRFVTQDVNIKRQVSTIMWGTALSGIPYLLVAFFDLFTKFSGLVYTYALFFTVFIPFSYAYVIYQRKLVRVDFAINRAVVLFVFTLLTGLVFTLLSLGATRALNLSDEVAFIGGAAAAVASLIAPTLRQVVQRRVDLVLYGCHYDFAAVTGTFSERLAQAIDRETLDRLLTHDLAEQMGIRQAALFLAEGDTLELQSSSSESGTFPTNSEVCRALLEARGPVRADVLRENLPDARVCRGTFDWVRLFVPLVFQDRLHGLLLLSDRYFGDIYSAVDVRIIAAVAHQGALAYESVRLVEALRGLNQQLVRADEAERKQVARELHDTALQQLFFVKQGLFRHKDTLETQIDLLEDTIGTLRRTIRGLRPPLLDQGLHLALQSLVDEVRNVAGGTPMVMLQSNVETRLGLSDEQATALYRIAQEAMSNALKHAGAQEVVVALEAEGDGVQLGITDDGAGVLEDREGHYGLVGMRERAAMIGAQLDVASTPGQGTRVTVEIASSAQP